MLTIELSSHSHLLTACGKHQSQWPSGEIHHRTTKPVFARRSPDRHVPAVHGSAQQTLARAPRQQSPGCSEIGFVSKLQIHRPAFIRGLCTMCTILPKSPIGFVFSTPGRPVLCAQVCTNMHKSLQSPRESYPANSNNSQPVIKNWLRSAKTVRPTSGKHFGPFELFIGSTAGDRALFCRPV